MIRGYIKRDKQGKFERRRQRAGLNPVVERWVRVVALGVLLGILAGISLDGITNKPVFVQNVNAEELEVIEPEEVMIEVRYDWTKERIEQEIRDIFPEDPETALKIAKCESGLRMIQSNHQKDGVREPSFGIFQIHELSWHYKAKQLGYDNYQTDILDNLAMARYIYDNAGKKWTDWSCYTKRMI